MTTLHQSYKHIANIISFKSDTNTLKNDIINNKIDWESIVRVASDHLVLTTVYCRLKQKLLLEFIPQDLQVYLNELTVINRNRNIDILNEIKAISNIFTINKIDHVFLKGSALLSLNYFEDLGERMIGDIDILVEKNQIEQAKILLNSLNYESTKLLLSDKYQDKRHIPRLVNKNKLAAIEIHYRLLKSNHNDKLKVSHIFQNKQVINSISVPSSKHLLAHTILSFQINDNGNYYNTIHLKNIYDGLIICKSSKIDSTINNPDFLKYLLFSSIYFKDFKTPIKSLKNKISIHFFQLKTKSNTFRKVNLKFLKSFLYFKILMNRFWLFVFNKNYRKEVLVLLKNRYLLVK